MSLRNFWVDTKVDGRTPTGTGPAAEGGGFEQVISIRSLGVQRETLTVVGEAGEGGLLTLRVLDADDVEVYRVESRR